MIRNLIGQSDYFKTVLHLKALDYAWRWTGYNTVFSLAGLQNIDRSIYEAARIDGACSSRQFFYITIPLLKPVILLTSIMSLMGHCSSLMR